MHLSFLICFFGFWSHKIFHSPSLPSANFTLQGLHTLKLRRNSKMDSKGTRMTNERVLSLKNEALILTAFYVKWVLAYFKVVIWSVSINEFFWQWGEWTVWTPFGGMPKVYLSIGQDRKNLGICLKKQFYPPSPTMMLRERMIEKEWLLLKELPLKNYICVRVYMYLYRSVSDLIR